MAKSGAARAMVGLVLGVFLIVAPAGAQVVSPFPAPVIAPVDPGATPGPAAILAFYRDPTVPPAEPVLVVDLATPILELPDGTRVSVVTGDPNGAQRRTSLYLEAGAVRGEVEEGDPAGFLPLEGAAPAQTEVTTEGDARIGIEPTGDADLVWVETETPDGTVSVSPIFPLSQVIEAAGTGALTPASVASVFGADNTPTGEFVELGAVPTLEVGNQGVTVRTTQPIPTVVAGVPVTEVRDFLRIVPDFESPGSAPYFVYIDYTAGTVTYFDASGGIPVVVDVPEESWLIDGLDATDAETASVSLDRAGLLAAAGLPVDADVGISVSRAVVLEDGRYLTAEGPAALLSWFGAGTVDPTPVDPTTSVPTTATPPTAPITDEASEDDGPNATVLIVAALLAVALAGVALYASRQNRRALLGDPDSALGAMAKVVDKAAHDQPETDESGSAAGAPRRTAAPSGVRVPAARERSVSDAVGAKGARVVVSREAQARAAARDQPMAGAPTDSTGHDPIDGPDDAQADDVPADGGRDALWAAMRKKAARAEPGEAGGDDDDAAPDETATPDAASSKSTTPDDALNALNRFIEDLRLPGER